MVFEFQGNYPANTVQDLKMTVVVNYLIGSVVDGLGIIVLLHALFCSPQPELSRFWLAENFNSF